MVAKPAGSQGFISIFLLIVSLVGAAAGVALGYALDGLVSGRRLLALLTALFAVVLVGFVRRGLGALFPSLFLAPRGTVIPAAVWVSIGYSALVGGLAGHDLSTLAGIASGTMVGFLSGTLAAVSMGTLMIIYFREHPEKGVEF